jgi:type IV pilus assembly protein PilC
MGDVYSEVSAGSSLSNGLAKHPMIFQPIFISLLNAGEETGNLTQAFGQVIRHLKWSDEMAAKIKKATRYPKILIVVVVGVVGLMMGYVVPEVVGFLKNIDQALPPITKALISTSEFVTAYALHIIGVIVFIYMFIRIGRVMSEGFRYRTDYVALHTPVMGAIIRKISLSMFCQTFAVLFTSGLEILKCLDAAKKTSTNMVILEALDNVRTQVQEGSPISMALNNSGEFPSLVVRMVKIGEESGNLSGVLEQVAEFYDKDVNEAVDAMIAMIEPALTVILGGIMLWIAAAVFGPVYDSFSKMGV